MIEARKRRKNEKKERGRRRRRGTEEGGVGDGRLQNRKTRSLPHHIRRNVDGDDEEEEEEEELGCTCCYSKT